MGKYDNYRTISQLTGIGTEELNKMKKSEMYTIIQKYGKIAISRRYKVQEYFDSLGIEPPQQYGYQNTNGMRSWRLAEFDVSMSDSTGKMKSVIRNIQRYLQSDYSTISGIMRQERQMYYSLAKRVGVPTYTDRYGNERILTLSKEYKEFQKALSSLTGFHETDNKYAQRYENTRLFWEIIDKVQEIYKDETVGASSRVQLQTVKELIENKHYTIYDAVFNIVDRLRGEYVKQQERDRENAPEYSNYTDFFEE